MTQATGKASLEARICLAIQRNHARWIKERRPLANSASVRDQYMELHRRYLGIREEIIMELSAELEARDPREYLMDEMDYSEFTFIFDTQNECYVNSHVDAVGEHLKEIFNWRSFRRVLDVGSGLGEQSFTAALFGPSVRGIEVNPYFYRAGLLLRGVFDDLPGIRSVDLRRGDFFKEDIGGFDLYLIYLVDDLLAPLLERVDQMASRGAVVLFSRSEIRPPQNWVLNKRLDVYIKED